MSSAAVITGLLLGCFVTCTSSLVTSSLVALARSVEVRPLCPFVTRRLLGVRRACCSASLLELQPTEVGSRLLGRPTEVGNLVLVRHGETEWDKTRWVGWADPDLNEAGAKQALAVATTLKESGYSFDVCYSSVLKRAVHTAWVVLKELNLVHLPVWKTWRLNERSYGALTGRRVEQLLASYGDDTIASWRRSFASRPPAYPADHPFHPAAERKYQRWQDRRGQVRPVRIPGSESLADCIERCLPVWHGEIIADLKEGRNVLVVAHGNSIRALVQAIDGISDDEIAQLEIPPAIPLVYRLQRVAGREGRQAGLAPLPLPDAPRFGGHTGMGSISGEFLADTRLVQRAQELMRRQSMARYSAPHGGQPPQLSAAAVTGEGTGAVGSGSEPPRVDVLPGLEANVGGGVFTADDGSEWPDLLEMAVAAHPSAEEVHEAAAYFPHRFPALLPGLEGNAASDMLRSADETSHATTVPTAAAGSGGGGMPSSGSLYDGPGGAALVPAQWWLREESKPPDPSLPCVVIIRHGKTEHNKLGLFTGWEDAPLAKEGRAEAVAAGQLLARHGLSFDVVYTSWLSRAIETSWLVLTEIDALWTPVHKSWRLNERMYGALTGLSKKKTRAKYGEQQFKLWRRSYDTKPPPVDSFSPHYPGNDRRYVQEIKDVRISLSETLVRSFALRRLSVHRKLPRTESLKDCMERTIPYWIHSIEREAIGVGKSVLVASSENAIRGLLMHLFDIPEERISEIEIPTGLPLLYDQKANCLRLLEGSPHDYNFGKGGAELLFGCGSGDGRSD